MEAGIQKIHATRENFQLILDKTKNSANQSFELSELSQQIMANAQTIVQIIEQLNQSARKSSEGIQVIVSGIEKQSESTEIFRLDCR